MMVLPAAALLIATVSAITGQSEVAVSATISPDSVRIGEATTLVVSVRGFPAGADVVFPVLPDTGTIAFSAPPKISDDPEGGGRTASYELTAWKVGDLSLPAAAVMVVTGGAELLVPVPDVVLHVSSVIPADADTDTLQWQPVADVVGPNWSTEQKLALAGTLVVLLLAAFLYARRRGVVSPVPIPAGPAPRDRALAALDRLVMGGLLEAGEFKAYYSALSQVLREFLAETDGEWGLDLTTPEVMAAVGRDGVAPSEVLSLAELLIGADLVKFARQRPTAEQASASLVTARDWIARFERAVPEPPAAPNEEADVEGVPEVAGAEDHAGSGDQDDEVIGDGAMAVLAELFAAGEREGEAEAEYDNEYDQEYESDNGREREKEEGRTTEGEGA